MLIIILYIKIVILLHHTVQKTTSNKQIAMSYKKGKLVIHCLCQEEEVKVTPDTFTG